MLHKFNHIRKFISTEELNRLQEKIISIESKTSGEIRLCLKNRINFFEKPDNAVGLAKKFFYKYGMYKTAEKNGVLILVLFRERKAAIIGDSGIHDKINNGFWDKVIAEMTEHFKNGKYYEGILSALETVGNELARNFPRKSDDVNELKDDIIIK